MIDNKYIELMNGELDGVNSAEESLELKNYLERHPEARRYYEELVELVQMLGRAEDVEPPPELREIILTSISQKREEFERKSLFSSALEAFRHNFRREYAYAFAAGIIVGICLFAILSHIGPGGRPSDLDDFYGTLGIKSRAEQLIGTEPIEFEFPEVSGSAHVKYSKDIILTELSLSSDSEISVVFQYDENVRFEGLRTLAGVDHKINVTEKMLELTHNGISDYVIILKGANQADNLVSIKIKTGRGLLLEKSIDLRRM